MPLTQATSNALYDYLHRVVERFVRQQAGGALYRPFHQALLPSVSWHPFSEHSFATRTGGWIQDMALIIGKQFHEEAQLQYDLTGYVRSAAKTTIDDILRRMNERADRRIPNRDKDLADVLAQQSPGGEETKHTVDLYLRRHDGAELFFELKTPFPNKGQARDMKRMILTVMAIKKGTDAEAYAASAYNPYSAVGRSEPYLWGMGTRQFLEVGRDFLLGVDFWRLVGDEDTYGEILQIASAVGRQLDPLVAELMHG